MNILFVSIYKKHIIIDVIEMFKMLYLAQNLLNFFKHFSINVLLLKLITDKNVKCF